LCSNELKQAVGQAAFDLLLAIGLGEVAVVLPAVLATSAFAEHEQRVGEALVADLLMESVVCLLIKMGVSEVLNVSYLQLRKRKFLSLVELKLLKEKSMIVVEVEEVGSFLFLDVISHRAID